MKKIPWWEPQIGKTEYSLINDVLKRNFPNEGPLTIDFENQVADLLQVKHIIAVTSATAAMYLSLKALNITHGDEVIVPDITFIATANAVEMTGAKAVLVDVDPKTFTIDVAQFKKAVTKKTKAVIPVHVSGRAANIEEILVYAEKEKIPVIEDAAEAFFSQHNGKFLGTFGITGCFSLSPAKTITTGQGGLIATNDDAIFRKLKELKDQGRPTRGTGGDDIHHSLGFNFKFTDLQAAIGIGQLQYLKKRVARMRKNYELYVQYLKEVKNISLFHFDIAQGELPQWADAIVEERDKLDSYLKGKNIDCRRYWHPIHRQKYYKTSDKHFPNSTALSPKAIWLPSAFTMRDLDVKRVCSEIKKYYR